MGFLSKLFGGDKAAEKVAESVLTGLFGGNGSSGSQSPASSASAPAPAAPTAPAADQWDGDNEWDRMPAEENQYNSGVHFTQYFQGIFAAELPGYRMEKTVIDDRRYVYTFFNGAAKVLVVELMPEACSAYKLRNDTKKEGVAYLRFYYDHHGWWNTRSYVAGRLHGAVG